MSKVQGRRSWSPETLPCAIKSKKRASLFRGPAPPVSPILSAGWRLQVPGLPGASVSVGQGLRDLFQAVLDRVPDRRALGLVANLRDDVPLGVLHHHLEAHAWVGRPSA